MSFVKIENINKSFGDTVALKDVNLSVEEGEFVSILGPSGSGKTTLLKLLSGFEKPDNGSIVIDGESILGLDPEDRDMSLVFQRLALFPHMTVFDNVAFGLRMKLDLSEDEIERRVEEMLNLVGLEGYEDRHISNLSGGEQQRVALVRALVVEPKVILYDEPLSDLDRQLREEMRREIKKIHEDLEITSIYVTHNQREALTLSNRIVVLQDGRIERFDAPEEIYENPQSEFVANFVGESNFLRGSIDVVDDEAWFESDDIRLPLSDYHEVQDDVTIYIRPEDIAIDSNIEADYSFTASVRDAVHLGSVAEYNLRIGETNFRSTALGAPQYRRGDEVEVVIEEYGII